MRARYPALRSLLGKHMDPLSNMIVAIKNAGTAGHDSVSVPHSKMKESIASVLEKEGFIKGFSKKMHKGKPMLDISLFVEGRQPKIKGVKRVSKTSKRIYKKSSELRPVRSGYGLMIITTPEGVMSALDAKRAKLGGEVLFTIW
jgi:small subunit ribosomal protein S8